VVDDRMESRQSRRDGVGHGRGVGCGRDGGVALRRLRRHGPSS